MYCSGRWREAVGERPTSLIVGFPQPLCHIARASSLPMLLNTIFARAGFSYCEFSSTQLIRIASLAVITNLIPMSELLRISKIKSTWTNTNFLTTLQLLRIWEFNLFLPSNHLILIVGSEKKLPTLKYPLADTEHTILIGQSLDFLRNILE